CHCGGYPPDRRSGGSGAGTEQPLCDRKRSGDTERKRTVRRHWQAVKRWKKNQGRISMNEQYKSGFAALIGRPNVGKSTLMNHLIGQKIAITSKKPQTTRNRIQTVYTCEEGQIVFLDTPGIHKAKNKLGEYMVNVAERTLKEVD